MTIEYILITLKKMLHLKSFILLTLMTVTHVFGTDNIGKLIITGFHGTSKSDSTVQQIKQHIDNHTIGGVILYNRNIQNKSQLQSLINYITADTNALITIDHEGGNVNRLTDSSFKLNTPSAEIFCKLPTEKQQQIAQKTAHNLKEIGINVNFGGVADIQPIIQESSVCKSKRCYSDNTSTLVDCLKHHSNAHTENNIIYTIKHFPGISFSEMDSHISLPDITKNHSPINYMPYHILNKNNQLQMVMVGHVLNKNIDEKFPSSLSKKTINYLTNIIQYNGLIITDDLKMGALNQFNDINQISLQALRAGNHLLLFEQLNSNEITSINKTLNNNLNKDPELKHHIKKSITMIDKVLNNFL